MEDRFGKFTSLILNISRCIQKIKNEEMAELGLKGKQASALFQLYCSKDGMTSGELSVACDEDKAATSRVVKELETSGYVFVDSLGDKKYKNKIRLTSKGNEIAEIVSKKVEKILNLVGVKKDRDKFYATLQELSEKLQETCQQYGE